MATQKQIDANRLNAQKGGPKTTEGKERISQNAITHGLCSTKHLMKSEDHDEFQELLKTFLHDYRPQNGVEYFLVQNVARRAWRMMRSGSVEAWSMDVAAQNNKRLHQLPSLEPDPETDHGHIAETLMNERGEHFALILRYTGAANRDFDRALKAASKILERADEARKQEREAEKAEAMAPQAEAPIAAPKAIPATAAASQTPTGSLTNQSDLQEIGFVSQTAQNVPAQSQPEPVSNHQSAQLSNVRSTYDAAWRNKLMCPSA